MPRLFCLAALFALFFAPLCRAENPPAVAQFAVVDLDKVAVDMGWMAQMKENLTTLQGQFRSDLSRVQGAQEGQLAQKRKDLGLKDTDTVEEIAHKLTQPQQQELVQMMNSSRQQLFQLQQSANQQFQGYEANWIKQYREAIAPAVKKVASEQKILMVLSPPPGTVLYLDSSVDLTAQVLKELKANPPTLQPVPFPQLLNPTTQPAATQPAAK